jgi:hypothetical protein
MVWCARLSLGYHRSGNRSRSKSPISGEVASGVLGRRDEHGGVSARGFSARFRVSANKDLRALVALLVALGFAFCCLLVRNCAEVRSLHSTGEPAI